VTAKVLSPEKDLFELYLSETQRETTAERTVALVHRKCPQHHSVTSGTGQTVQTELRRRKNRQSVKIFKKHRYILVTDQQNIHFVEHSLKWRLK